MTIRTIFTSGVILLGLSSAIRVEYDVAQPPDNLAPLVGKNQPVDWFFVFKFNSESFPGCDNPPVVGSAGIFGGNVFAYAQGKSQQYLVASSEHPMLEKQSICLGATDNDPLGSTFAQVYLTNKYNYVIWNDQFYSDPQEFGLSRSAPWAHSKGMLAWDTKGSGFVLQVTTPSWPAAGSGSHPRKTDGNTLGCIKDDNIKVSQHFFCLKINKDDLVKLLNACINASVVTDPTDLQVVKNGGPAEVIKLVKKLGKISKSKTMIKATLSSGVQVLSKPHAVEAPPWQLVSAEFDGVPLRVASWWQSHLICSTTINTTINCWPTGLKKPGAVEIVKTGTWDNVSIGLVGGNSKSGNHAKFGVSKDPTKPYSIFGDMNQEGTLTASPKCNVSQNPRGGLFYVVENQELFRSVTALLTGETALVGDCSH